MALHTSTFMVRKSATEQISVSIVDMPCAAEGLSLTTWSSAGILSNLLHKLEVGKIKAVQSDDVKDDFAILELGAGTGLSGLSAAALWGQRALLTDLPTIVPGIQANVDLNAHVLREHGASAVSGTLDWTKPDMVSIPKSDNQRARTFTVDEVNGFPIILAADTMYTEEHPVLLSQTILRCLRRSPSARAIVVYAMRVAYIDHMREFWELMEAGGLVAEQEGREEIDLREWDDEKLHEWSVWKWKDL
ncbi:putative methyltransferase-domain-containing protein [Coniella lustricola]|uniref:Putative methyltransferase-domain-containing protein n=1 Tax=Coniella lustricola TaxID=2025994 RepID=A0A2T3A021_9PEZI|nr:putative methyltransferase-domain-containing protein [Coniella lustricola]